MTTQTPNDIAAEDRANADNDKATARANAEMSNKSRTFDQDQLDELEMLVNQQALDDGDLSGMSAWGPMDMVYRAPRIESFVDLIGGDVEMEDEDEIEADEDEIEAELAARTAEDKMWDGRYWKAFRSEQKRRPAPVVHLPAPQKEIPDIAILIEAGPMSSPCCSYAGKKHYHHKCSRCGGMASAKKELDTSKDIFCSDCYLANKQAAAAK